MQKTQKGGFLFETLLILSIIIAIMPMMVTKLSDRKILQENVATEKYIQTLFDTTKNFISDTKDSLPDGKFTLEKESLISFLEPYGLPTGFSMISPLGQEVSLIIDKQSDNIFALLSFSETKKKLSLTRKAELVLRIGYYGSLVNDKGILVGSSGSWEEDLSKYNISLQKDNIYVLIPTTAELSEMVSRKKNGSSTEQQKMHVNLDMNNNDIANVEILDTSVGHFKTVETENIAVSADVNTKNSIRRLNVKNAIFSNILNTSDVGLNIIQSFLKGDIIISKNIGLDNNYNLNLVVNKKLSVSDIESDNLNNISLLNIRKNLISEDKNFDINNEKTGKIKTHKIISPFINSYDAESETMYSDDYEASDSFVYSPVIKTNSISFYDISNLDLVNLTETTTEAPIANIDFNKTSIFPDIFSNIMNDTYIKIPVSIEDRTGRYISCQSFIESLGGYTYNEKSLSQRLVCLNVRYYRLWVRAKIKQCMKTSTRDTAEEKYRECKATIM